MPEPTINIIKRHGLKRIAQRHVQVLRRAWSPTTHQSFDLRPTVLYRREVRRIGWQPQDLGLDRRHRLLNLTRQMHRQIVQKQNIRGAQLRAEHLFDIRIKDQSIHRTLNAQWRKQPAQTQTPDQGHGLAMIARHSLADSLATRRTPVGSGQGQMKASFVREDQAATIQASHPPTESLPVGFDSFGCPEAFFYAAARVSEAHGKYSRDALALWPFFSNRRPVPRVWRRVALPLAVGVRRATSRSMSPDNRRRAAAARGSDPHARVSSFWRGCNGLRQKYQPLRRECLRQFHRLAPVFLASQLSTPSCLNEWRKSQYQCKRKPL